MSDQRHDSADEGAPKALSSRVESTIAIWRTRLREQITGRQRAAKPVHDITAAAEALRQQLHELERDAVDLRRNAAREAAAAAEWEERAMSAIRTGNDGAAREAVRNHERHRAAIARIEADLAVLLASEGSCRDAIAQFDQLLNG